jgi:hypothetical protein
MEFQSCLPPFWPFCFRAPFPFAELRRPVDGSLPLR